MLAPPGLCCACLLRMAAPWACISSCKASLKGQHDPRYGQRAQPKSVALSGPCVFPQGLSPAGPDSLWSALASPPLFPSLLLRLKAQVAPPARLMDKRECLLQRQAIGGIDHAWMAALTEEILQASETDWSYILKCHF